MPRTTPMPQTSAYPCPVCHAPTRAGVISRTLRLVGLPAFLSSRMRFAKLWTCPVCSARGGEIPFTYLTFGGMNFRNLVVATYHQGLWSLEQHTSRDTINAITRIENDIQPAPTEGVAEEWNPPVPAPTTPVPTPTPAETPSQEAAWRPPEVGLTHTPLIRVRINETFFARDATGAVYQWMHDLQPIELGHWEQIGSTASEDTAGVTNFCTNYVHRSDLRCDCGALLTMNPPLNLYRTGLSAQQVQEVDRRTAGYYHCNDQQHHPDGGRRGFLRFSDGAVMQYGDDGWTARQAPPTPAGAGVNPQEVLELLIRKLEREHPDDEATDLMATELVRVFDANHDPARVQTVGSFRHLDLAVAILRKAGYTSQAELVEQYEGPDDS